MAQMTSGRSAFLCQGDSEAEEAVNTPKDWKVWRDDAYAFSTDEAAALRTYCVVGPSETLDAARHPWGWETADFDDTGWSNAASAGRAFSHGAQDAGSFWWLTPRELPAMEETPVPFGRVVRAEGMDAPAGAGAEPFTVPAHAKVTLLFDHGNETCAFPELIVSGGDGATLRLAYAEALRDAKTGQKGDRNDIEGKVLRGYSDSWRLDGGEHRVLSPLWWRTFRYAEMTIETADAPLVVTGLRAIYTGYPFAERARFEAPEQADLSDLMTIGWRTLRLCAHETFMDCPYYEQLQYAGDTRIQCLVSLYTSGDARLFRTALAHLDDSRLAFGLTQSRFPSRLPQIISPFSLWWVCMVHDYWQHVPGDDDFLKGMLTGIRGVLQWFGDRIRKDGLLGPLEWWSFADWCNEWRGGVPPGAKEGGSALLTLQYALALDAAGELHTYFGQGQEAQRLHREKRKVLSAVKSLCYDGRTHRVADTPEKKSFSQHTASLLVLSPSVLTDKEKRAVMERALSDPEVTQATFYFRFYLHRALTAAGLGDRFLETLAPWREMKRIGLTTWAEKPEPTRSDCHAWSASPNYELLATVLGVMPGEPGWKSVRIAPHLGPLTRASGRVPHPKGDVDVALEKRDGGGLTAEITLPEGVTGSLRWAGHSVPLTCGYQKVTV